jgi:hypothetical protein
MAFVLATQLELPLLGFFILLFHHAHISAKGSMLQHKVPWKPNLARIPETEYGDDAATERRQRISKVPRVRAFVGKIVHKHTNGIRPLTAEPQVT